MEHGGRKTVIKENYVRKGSSCADRLESAKNKAHAARRNHSPPL